MVRFGLSFFIYFSSSFFPPKLVTREHIAAAGSRYSLGCPLTEKDRQQLNKLSRQFISWPENCPTHPHLLTIARDNRGKADQQLQTDDLVVVRTTDPHMATTKVSLYHWFSYKVTEITAQNKG